MASYTYERAKAQAVEAVREALGEVVQITATPAPAVVAADLAIPCFPFAAGLREGPDAIAQQLAQSLRLGPMVEAVSAQGGYLNFTFNRPLYAAGVMADLARLHERYGSTDIGGGRAVVIDYSSPNIARPMSVGHLRSTIIGAALYRLMAFAGFRPVGINHPADLGTQFGSLLYAFTMWVDREEYGRAPVRELFRLYVKFDEEAQRQPDLRERAREWSRRLETGDPEARRLWEEIVRHSTEEFARVYDLLEVKFDATLGESFYLDKTPELIAHALERGVAVRDEGALIVRLDDVGIKTPLILQRSDGATLYATRDLAAAIYRIKTYQPSQLLYVVGADQRLYFRQLFATLQKLGYNDVHYVHVDFGDVTLPGGRMSTRRGRVVFLEDVLKEAVVRARRLVDEKNPDLPDAERAQVAREVGIGAVKYADLSQNRGKNVAFDWDRMLSLDGDSAPYLQYTYVRAQGILRKGEGVPLEGPFDGRAAATEQEWRLLTHLSLFPEVAREAVESYTPHMVANYLFHLAQGFHAFYHDVPVLQASDAPLRASRLQVVQGVATVMRTGLGLLGIHVPERM